MTCGCPRTLVGVDNDKALCNLIRPLLSSAKQAAQQIGYAAAEVLAVQ